MTGPHCVGNASAVVWASPTVRVDAQAPSVLSHRNKVVGCGSHGSHEEENITAKLEVPLT